MARARLKIDGESNLEVDDLDWERIVGNPEVISTASSPESSTTTLQTGVKYQYR